jgi:hypothetical protein
MKITERIFDATTGETTDVERTLTAAEVKELEAIQAEAAKRQEIVEQKASDKAALLAKLGITTDEARLLLS